MWDLVLRPGIEPRPPALGAWSLNHWATSEVPMVLFYLVVVVAFISLFFLTIFYFSNFTLFFILCYCTAPFFYFAAPRGSQDLDSQAGGVGRPELLW